MRTPWKTWRVPFEGDAEALLEECRKLLHTPAEMRIEYMKPQTTPPLYKRFRNRYHELKCFERDRSAGSYFPVPRMLSLQTIKNRLPQKWFKYPEPEYDVKEVESLKKIRTPICYLPLHMEPEATILMYSPWLRDQIEACRLVSQALPVGWKLLVKENPKMRGMRPLDYYRRLKAIPNVVLVSTSVDSTSLVLAARVTVTVAGTASNEAAILGKASIVLGRPAGLGMLAAGDLSSQLSLAELFETIQQDYKLDLIDWKNWLGGSFPAKQVPAFTSEGVYCTPQDKKNIGAFVRYILVATKISTY
jgi:hypothetical protein